VSTAVAWRDALAMLHRSEDFRDGHAVSVMFYGPEGGEAASTAA
jgi:hypothetical protein